MLNDVFLHFTFGFCRLPQTSRTKMGKKNRDKKGKGKEKTEQKTEKKAAKRAKKELAEKGEVRLVK